MEAVVGKRLTLPDADATEALGGAIATELRVGDVLLLEGVLGAGKTTLVRGLVAALGGRPGEVCSPTFVLLESYDVSRGAIRRVHHADLYRIRGSNFTPWEEVGLGEALDDPAAVTAVEWPGEVRFGAPGRGRILRVRLAFADPLGRTALLDWFAR